MLLPTVLPTALRVLPLVLLLAFAAPAPASPSSAASSHSASATWRSSATCSGDADTIQYTYAMSGSCTPAPCAYTATTGLASSVVCVASASPPATSAYANAQFFAGIDGLVCGAWVGTWAAYKAGVCVAGTNNQSVSFSCVGSAVVVHQFNASTNCTGPSDTSEPAVNTCVVLPTIGGSSDFVQLFCTGSANPVLSVAATSVGNQSCTATPPDNVVATPVASCTAQSCRYDASGGTTTATACTNATQAPAGAGYVQGTAYMGSFACDGPVTSVTYTKRLACLPEPGGATYVLASCVDTRFAFAQCVDATCDVCHTITTFGASGAACSPPGGDISLSPSVAYACVSDPTVANATVATSVWVGATCQGDPAQISFVNASACTPAPCHYDSATGWSTSVACPATGGAQQPPTSSTYALVDIFDPADKSCTAPPIGITAFRTQQCQYESRLGWASFACTQAQVSVTTYAGSQCTGTATGPTVLGVDQCLTLFFDAFSPYFAKSACSLGPSSAVLHSPAPWPIVAFAALLSVLVAVAS